eukprot:1343809-Amphidinium_carterae.1
MMCSPDSRKVGAFPLQIGEGTWNIMLQIKTVAANQVLKNASDIHDQPMPPPPDLDPQFTPAGSPGRAHAKEHAYDSSLEKYRQNKTTGH